MRDISLYIHIPFCARKCTYCDFVSHAEREGDWARYLSCLEEEMHASAKRYGRIGVDTLYIGGGTPSLLPADAVMHLIAMARALFVVGPGAEITVEANPGTLTGAKLSDYRASGVNRLSMGMQSKSHDMLNMLGRIHTQDDVVEAFALARAAGFDNLSLDLMYALPGQSMADWVDTLKAAMSLAPKHISCYSLILEPGTPLANRVEAGELPRPDDETALAMCHAAMRMLKKRGYARYEISNYALPGYESRHNTVYWTRGEYLGLGCAAHSLMDGERFANTGDLSAYLSGARVTMREAVSEESAREEAIMLGTRMARGIDVKLIESRIDAAQKLASLGLVELSGGRLRLTDKGFDVHNAVVLELV